MISKWNEESTLKAPSKYALGSLACLAAFVTALITLAEATFGTFGHVVLWIAVVAFLVLCFTCLDETLKFHAKGGPDLLPGAVALLVAGGILLFGAIFGSGQGSEGFKDFTLAISLIALGYALWTNTKTFGIADGVIIGLIQAVFAIVVVGLAYLIFSGSGSGSDKEKKQAR